VRRRKGKVLVTRRGTGLGGGGGVVPQKKGVIPSLPLLTSAGSATEGIVTNKGIFGREEFRDSENKKDKKKGPLDTKGKVEDS